jgi:hypothetical protein
MIYHLFLNKGVANAHAFSIVNIGTEENGPLEYLRVRNLGTS